MNINQPKPSLRGRVLKAGAWVFGGHVLEQVLRLGSNLIMTRLLVPEMFGTMAVAHILIFGISMLSDVGLQRNIIQSHRGDDPVFLNTVWTVQILRGSLITLLAIAGAFGIYLIGLLDWWPADSVYAEPVLPYVTGVLGFNALIAGFQSTKLASANRRLSMGLITRIELISQVFGLGTMILWAVIDRSIWALVAGSAGGTALTTILSHLTLPGERNRLQWDGDAFHEIVNFGKWIFLGSILGFSAASADRLVLGGLVNSSTLGIYSIAFLMANALREVLSTIAGNVVFPALSEVARARPQELRQIYYRFRLPVDIVTLFAAGMLFTMGHLIVELLYDERYLAAGHILEVLSISLFFERYDLSGQCFLALGKPKLFTPLLGLRLIALFGFMPLAFHWYGLEGASWAIAVHRVFTLPLLFYFKLQHNLLSWYAELRTLPLFPLGLLFGWLFNSGVVYLGWKG